MFETILLPVLIIAGIGLIFGIILAVASKVMAVPVDERITKIRAALPLSLIHIFKGGFG